MSWKNIGSYSRSKNNEIVRTTTTNIIKNIIFQPNDTSPRETGVSFSDNTFQYTAAYNLWLQNDPSSNIYYDKGVVSVNTDETIVRDTFTKFQNIPGEDNNFGNISLVDKSGEIVIFSYVYDNKGFVVTYQYNKQIKQFVKVSTITNDSDEFGASLSIDESSSLLAVGDPKNNMVYIYNRNSQYNGLNKFWNEELDPVTPTDKYTSTTVSFGNPVSISSYQGKNWALSVSDIDGGNVYVYIYILNDDGENADSQWTQYEFMFDGNKSRTAQSSKFGFANKIIFNNEFEINLLVSAPWRNETDPNDLSKTITDAGIVNLVTIDWSNYPDFRHDLTKVENNDLTDYSYFGYSLDWFEYPNEKLDRFFIVSAPSSKENSQDSNNSYSSVYLYRIDKTGSDITLQKTIQQSNYSFGYSVSTGKLSNKKEKNLYNFAVGYPAAKNEGDGNVYIYNFNSFENIIEEKQLIFPLTDDISFGKNVSMSDSYEGNNAFSVLLVSDNLIDTTENTNYGNINLYQGFSEYIFNVDGNVFIDGDLLITEGKNIITQHIISDNVYLDTLKPLNHDKITLNGKLDVQQEITASLKNFKITHPLDDNKWLIHHSVESPGMDLLYAGETTLQNGKSIIDVDQLFSMSPGTFFSLNNNIKIFTSNEEGWDPVKGYFENNKFVIVSKNLNCCDKVSFLLLGTRKDEFAIKQRNKYNSNYLTEISK